MAENITITERYIKCRKCASYAVSKWDTGFWGNYKWKKAECGACHAIYDKYEMDLITFRVCPHCGSLTEATEDAVCVKCGGSILSGKDTLCIKCPECNTENIFIEASYFPEETHTCIACGKVLPTAENRDLSKVTSGPIIVSLPNAAEMDEKGQYIWKYGMSEFPTGSQLIVSEGTFALLLENGLCTDNRGPGNYLLEELKCGRSGKFNAGLSGESVVFKTDIFCVRERLPKCNFGICCHGIDEDHFLGIIGSADCRVVDAKQFASHYSYRDETLKENLHKEIQTRIETIGRRVIRDMLNRGKTLPFSFAEQDDFANTVCVMLGKELEYYGITADNLNIIEFVVRDTRVRKLKDAILSAAGRVVWQLPFRVYDQKQSGFYADYTLEGTLHLQVEDKASLFQAIELRDMFDKAGKLDSNHANTIEFSDSYIEYDKIEKFYDKMAHRFLADELPRTVKELMKETGYPLESLQVHLDDLNYTLRNRLKYVSGFSGLQVDFSSDDAIVKAANCTMSKEYIDYQHRIQQEEQNKINQQKRENELFAYIAGGLNWSLAEMTLHETENTNMFAKVKYSGSCNLEIYDREKVKEQPDLKQMLNEKVDKVQVQDKFRSVIEGELFAVIAHIAQNIINGENGSIRELEHQNFVLRNSVYDSLKDTLSRYGLNILSLFIDKPVITPSKALQNKWDADDRKTDIDTNQDLRNVVAKDEIHKVQTDSYIYNETADIKTDDQIKNLGRGNRIADSKLDSDIRDLERQSKYAEAQARKDELDSRLRQDKKARDHQENLIDISYQTAADNAIYTRDDRKDELSYQRNLDNFRRQARYDEEVIQKRLREDKIIQLGRIEKERIDQEAGFANEDRQDDHVTNRAVNAEKRNSAVAEVIHNAAIDEARFKEILSGIMRKIDQSDMDWNEKLAAYERLQHQLDAQARNEDEIASARVHAEIDSIRTNADAYRNKINAETSADKAVIEAKAAVAKAHGAADAYRIVGTSEVEVQRMRNDMDYDLAAGKLKLDDAEAQLVEKIARYAEDRNRRIATYTAELQQQRDVLMFQQSMEKERLLIATEMELIKQRYDDNRKNEEMQIELFKSKMEIEKLKLELEANASLAREDHSTARTKIESDMYIQKFINERMTATALVEALGLSEKIMQNMEERERDANRAHELSLKASDNSYNLQQAEIDLRAKQITADVEIEKVRSQSGSAELLGKIEQIIQTLDSKSNDQRKSDSEKLDKLLAAVSHISADADKNAKDAILIKTMKSFMEETRTSNKKNSDIIRELRKKMNDLSAQSHIPSAGTRYLSAMDDVFSALDYAPANAVPSEKSASTAKADSKSASYSPFSNNKYSL